MNFTFKKLLKSDLQLIKYWLSQPHVSRWFDDIDDWMNEISSNPDSDWIWHFRADLSSKPVGFVQYYDILKAPKGPWSSQPPGTVGIDFLIGSQDQLGKGYGILLVNDFVEFLIDRAKPKRIIADPVKENIASLRTLKRCGFTFDKESDLFFKETSKCRIG